MVVDAAHNVGLQTSSASFLSTLYDNYCEQDGSSKQSAFNASVSVIVSEIPVGLSGGGSNAESQIKNFCRNYQSSYQANSSSFDFRSMVVERALQSANECLQIATKTQSTITYKILTPSMMALNFEIPSGQNIKIKGISHDTSVSCTGSKISGSGTISYTTGTGQTIDADAGTYSIACTRQPFSARDGSTFYNSTGLVVDTNVGGVDILWPQDTALPLTTASQIQSSLSGLDNRLQALRAAVNYNALPVGTIVPWFEKVGAIPEGWAKCDGSNTGKCPNLTGLFLRGSSQADVLSTGGYPTSVVGQHGSDNRYADGNGWSIDGGHYLSKNTVSVDIIPPYVSVLYIKKIANQ
jgi:hypothetical protein